MKRVGGNRDLSLRITIRNEDILNRLALNYKKALADYAESISTLLLNNVRSYVRNYLRFSERHGWDYPYTGKLAASFYREIHKLDKGYRIRVAPQKPYDDIAAALEFGAVIRPKRKSALTVPIKGTSKPFTTYRTEAARRTLTLKKFGNSAFLGIMMGNKFVAYFVLKREVRIPPYAFMSKALTKTVKQLPDLKLKIALSR